MAMRSIAAVLSLCAVLVMTVTFGPASPGGDARTKGGNLELVSKPLGWASGVVAVTGDWPVQMPMFTGRHPPP